MRISDWSSDVCSSDLRRGDPREISRQAAGLQLLAELQLEGEPGRRHDREVPEGNRDLRLQVPVHHPGRLPRAELLDVQPRPWLCAAADERVRRAAGGRVRSGRQGLHRGQAPARGRSEAHTSELQSLLRTSYAVFCLKKTKDYNPRQTSTT